MEKKLLGKKKFNLAGQIKARCIENFLEEEEVVPYCLIAFVVINSYYFYIGNQESINEIG